MRLNEIIIVSLLGLTAASPAPGSLDGSSAVADDFKPDWDAVETDFNTALERAETDQGLAKRINTQSGNNVGYGQAIYAASAAAVNQVKSLSNWNKARKQYIQLITQIMMDHNPDPNTAVAAICYNKAFGVKNPDGIYGLQSEELSIWPAKTDWDCFYMGRDNAFWSYGDGGSINLYTRWYTGACRFDDKSDLYC